MNNLGHCEVCYQMTEPNKHYNESNWAKYLCSAKCAAVYDVRYLLRNKIADLRGVGSNELSKSDYNLLYEIEGTLLDRL